MLNVAVLKAKKTTLPPSQRGRAARNMGPNPFLDSAWPFNLKASYENAEAYEITVNGAYVDGVIEKGEKKGQKISRLTGDAADAVTLLRAAADKLGLGVSIPMPLKAGATKGTLVVKYAGAKRKQARKPKVAAVVPPVVAPTVPVAAVVPQVVAPK